MRSGQQPGCPQDGENQCHMPGSVMRKDLGHHTEGQCPQQRGRRFQSLLPQQALHPQAAPQQVQHHQQVESQGNGQQPRQPSGWIPKSGQRVGAQRRSAQDQRRPQSQALIMDNRILLQERVGVMRQAHIREASDRWRGKQNPAFRERAGAGVSAARAPTNDPQMGLFWMSAGSRIY